MGQSRGNLAFFSYRPPAPAPRRESPWVLLVSTHCLYSYAGGVVAVTVEPPESIPTWLATSTRASLPRSMIGMRICTLADEELGAELSGR